VGNTPEEKKFNSKHILLIAVISAIYLAVSAIFIGFKVEQLVLVCLFWIMYLASAPSRKIILGFSVFIAYWVIFDYMKLLPNYDVNNVHIKDLYDHEKNLFGVNYRGVVLTPHELFEKYQNPAFDLMSGLFYLCWVPVPIFLAAYLFYKNRMEFLKFSLTFLWINLIGFVIYYIYPAAPPWYIENYGTIFKAATPGNTAGLARFDMLVGVRIFHSLYSQSSNVFAAMPSLHSAYPLLVLYYGLKNKLGLVNILFGIIMIGIWLSAIYTGHHYLLDVIAGIIVCIIGIISFNRIIKWQPITKWLQSYFKLIS